MKPASSKPSDAWWVTVQMALSLVILWVGVTWQGTRCAVCMTLGALCWVYAGWVGVTGVRDLGKNRTTRPTPVESGELVTHGIYSRLRHPLYSAVMAMGFGWALFWSSVAAAILATVLAVFLRFKARHEESMLRDCYPGYAAYAKQVPAFVPLLKRFRAESPTPES